jgi:hypothetical protein
MLVTLELFRGLVAAVPFDQIPVLSLIFNGEEFELACRDHYVKSARGQRRSFSTSDAALRYVRENISVPLGRSVDVTIRVVPGGIGGVAPDGDRSA